MSYAEQFFGTKQNLVLQYAENLAFFGEESYVYKNANLMKEVIANEVALTNPTTAYYAYLWARENGLAAIDYFNAGLVIAIYNSELNMTFHFVLVDFNDDGSGLFINQEVSLMFHNSTATNGLEVLNYEHYESIQYLNGENNWYSKWTDKPASNTEVINVSANNAFRILRTKKGFLSGLDNKLKNLLKTFKEGYNFPILPISYDDFYKYTVTKPLLSSANLKTLSKNCVDMYETYSNQSGSSSIKIGILFYGCLLEEVTADQITTQPRYRAGWSSGGTVQPLNNIQNASNMTIYPSIFQNSPQNLKIQF